MPDQPAWIRDVVGGALLTVHARPVEGAANRALIAVLATALGVSQSRVTIEAGTSGREKRVRVAGSTAADVALRLLPGGLVDTARRGA